MKNLKIWKITKKIIYITIISLMLCNFIMPCYSLGADLDDGGELLVDIAQFFCFIPDKLIDLLQNMFVTQESIEKMKTEYIIKYSPGVIFAGQVPAFDINFITQEEEYKEEDNTTAVKSFYIDSVEFQKNYASKYNDILDLANDFYVDGVFEKNSGEKVEILGGLYPNTSGTIPDIEISLNDILQENQIEWIDGESKVKEGSQEFSDYNNVMFYGNNGLWESSLIMEKVKYNGVKYDVLDIKYKYVYVEMSTSYENTIIDYIVEGHTAIIKDIHTHNSFSVTPKQDVTQKQDVKQYKYTSYVLQPTISTWYRALRRIALVGLLSVLIYIGIRIVLTSTSAKDKAKYKNMLKDWLVALCILFTLHYIMSITINIVEKIGEIIKVSVIGPEGEDILMSQVRTNIARSSSWGKVIVQVIIYFVLTIYTIIFTIQYFRRTIYLAFLTMIAPLITLTYPLDKIKDSKSQAFDMWIKDYIFFTLIQVVHILLYYILLASTLDLADEGYWILALVAIGFMTKAEKIIKKMFGFEKSKTMGAMAAGATGALVMDYMNKMKGIGKTKSGGKESSTEGKTNSNVRTATPNPLYASQGGKVTGGNKSSKSSSFKFRSK